MDENGHGSQIVRLDQLCDDLLQQELFQRVVAARDLAAVACTSRRLRAMVTDPLWGALAVARLPRLVRLLEAAPPDWWAGRSWRQRLASLAGGATFSMQVFNRELENEQEDFLLSSYDAAVRLAPASARALLAGDASAPLLFAARYLPMGQMAAVEEGDVAPERLRLPPPGSSPFEVYGGGTAAACPELCVGEEVEVQWKGRRSHPFGWWFGTVQSKRGNRITLVFRQYPRTSMWHRVKAPIESGKEAVLNGDFSFGYVGGLRRLTPGEREEWRLHGAPQPPAPDALAALEAAAAEEEWSDEEEDEDFDIDADLAAELEAELEAALLAPAAAAGGGAAAAPAGAPAGAAGEGAGLPAAAAAAEDAAPAPAGPPGEPIALHLGHAGAGGQGQPVALAAGGGGLQQAAQALAPGAPAPPPEGQSA